jgi:hypothetical protein
VHAQGFETQHGGALAQDPDHDLLAQRRRQGRDAEVHRLAVHRDPGTPVLRPQAVGNVEARHDLDPGDQRDAGVARDLHDLPQHAVDPVADDDPSFDRLHVHVAGPAGHAVSQHHIHQADDRPLARLLGGGGGLFLVGDLLDLELAADSLEQAGDHLVTAAIQLVHLGPQPARRGEEHPDLASGGEGQHLLGVDVEGIGGGDLEVGVGLADRHDVEAPRELLGDGLRHPGGDPGHVGDREAEPGGDRREDLFVANQAPLHDRLPQRDRRRRLLLPEGGDRLIRQQRLESRHQPFVGELHDELDVGRR